MTSKITQKKLVNYLGDFFFTDKSTVSCDTQIHTFLKVCGDIGFPVALDKTEWSSEWKVFLGLLIHGRKQLICLPEQKVHDAELMIQHLLEQKKVTIKQVMSLAGKLNFFTRALNYGRTFLQSIFYLISPYHNRPGCYVHLTKEARADMYLWSTVMESEPYCKSFIEALDTPAQDVAWYTDASGNPNLGFGCFLNGAWMWGQCPVGIVNQFTTSSCLLELFAVTLSIVKWAQNFPNKRILIHCDNRAAVACLNNGTSWCHKCLHLLRIVAAVSIHFNMHFKAVYIATEDNGVADSLSRLQFSRFFQLVPSAQSQPEEPPPSLWPLSTKMRSSWLS